MRGAPGVIAAAKPLTSSSTGCGTLIQRASSSSRPLATTISGTISMPVMWVSRQLTPGASPAAGPAQTERIRREVRPGARWPPQPAHDIAQAVGCAELQSCFGPRLWVAVECGTRRPVNADRQRVRAETLELAGAIDDLAADHCQDGLDTSDLVLGHREVVGRKQREVGHLAGAIRPFCSSSPENQALAAAPTVAQ